MVSRRGGRWCKEPQALLYLATIQSVPKNRDINNNKERRFRNCHGVYLKPRISTFPSRHKSHRRGPFKEGLQRSPDRAAFWLDDETAVASYFSEIGVSFQSSVYLTKTKHFLWLDFQCRRLPRNHWISSEMQHILHSEYDLHHYLSFWRRQ